VNASTWHAYCVTPDPAEPAPLTRQQWKRLSDKELATQLDETDRWLARLFVRTPEIDQYHEWLTRLVRKNVNAPPGAKEIAALDGVNLAGKSTFLMRWARACYLRLIEEFETDDRGRPVRSPAPGIVVDVSPVIWTNLQSPYNEPISKQKSVSSGVLQYLSLPHEGVARDLTYRAIEALERHKAKVVIIDDIHFLETSRARDAQVVLDHIKHMNTQIGVLGGTLIVAGANLRGGEFATDPQIRGRLQTRTIRTYGAGSQEELKELAAIVYPLEVALLPHLPAAKPGILYETFLGELAYRTQGYIGDLQKLVHQAALAGMRDGSCTIHRRHIDAVILNDRAQAAAGELKRSSRGRGQKH
jgi:Bacterial TniB protein